jgi:hypothetical protein
MERVVERDLQREELQTLLFEARPVAVDIIVNDDQVNAPRLCG